MLSGTAQTTFMLSNCLKKLVRKSSWDSTTFMAQKNVTQSSTVVYSLWKLRKFISGRGFQSFHALNQYRLHLRVYTSLFTVFKIMRKLHVPVIRCQGKKHDNYLLVLVLFVDNCYYTTVRITTHKTQIKSYLFQNTLDKKGFKLTHKQLLCAVRKQTKYYLIHNSKEWIHRARNRMCSTNWKRGTNMHLSLIEQHLIDFQTSGQLDVFRCNIARSHIQQPP